MFNTLLSLDQSLLIMAHELVSPSMARLIQILGELIVLWGGIFLVTLWLYGTYRKDNSSKLIALKIFFLIVLVFSIYALINLGLPQWRPGAMELSGADALIPHPTDNSFPSGHALFSGALLIGIWRYLHSWPLIVFTIVMAIITATSRVIGGVHYPGDIIGGFFFGILGALFLIRVVEIRFFENKIFPLFIKIASWIKL